jgi:hypothetical protein
MGAWSANRASSESDLDRLKDFTIVAISTVEPACWQKAAATRVSERLLLAQGGHSVERRFQLPALEMLIKPRLLRSADRFAVRPARPCSEDSETPQAANRLGNGHLVLQEAHR